MRRTNIYLAEAQCSALDEMARTEGVSRAELIRRLIDHAVESERDDFAADTAAIEESFGTLAAEDLVLPRGPDGRSEHLRRMGA